MSKQNKKRDVGLLEKSVSDLERVEVKEVDVVYRLLF